MPTRTLAQLREEVRQTADITYETQWASDAEINRYINSALSDWWDLLLEVHGQEHYLEEYLVQTVAGTATYDIDDSSQAEFYALKGVDRVDGDLRVPLAPYNFLNRNYGTQGTPLWYRRMGSVDPDTGEYTKQIRFVPTPDGTYDIYLLYVPAAPVLDNDADVWHGHNGWEEYIVTMAAIRCLTKEESDTSALQLRKMELEQRIRNAAGSIDASFPEVVTDAPSVGASPGGPGYPSTGGLGGGGTVIITGGGGTTYDPNLLWEWNGTDVSQFEASGLAVGATVDPTPADPLAPPYTGGVLTVVDDATVVGGKVLRATMDIPSGMSSLAQGVLFLTVDDLGTDRFEIELTQVSINTVNRYVGVAWFGSVVLPANPPPSYAYCRLWGTAGNLMRVDTHEPVITTTTTAPNLLTEGGGVVRIVVDGDRDSSGIPRFRTHEIAFRDTGGGGVGSLTGGSTTQADWPSEPAGAAWATNRQSRFGLAMRVAGGIGTGITHFWDIRAIRIYKHPRDRQP